jgi:predicted GNAT family acetyltransferase
MSSAFATTESEVASPEIVSPGGGSLKPKKLQVLSNDQADEILAFLGRRPIHTVCMASYIRDHGVVSPLNRGVFYGCRDEQGRLEGVALIGHATLIETQSDDALKAFADLKHQSTSCHLVRGEHTLIERFWNYLSELGHTPRLAYREFLYELEKPTAFPGSEPELRVATLDDIDQVLEINSRMILSECGIDPLKKDPQGFRERVARRIKRDRVWVWSRNGRLVFKADIFAETPEMIYLEGVNVHEQDRRNHHGLRCMAQLSRILLQRSKSICLLVNERKEKLGNFYTKAGFQFKGIYDTIYLHSQAE